MSDDGTIGHDDDNLASAEYVLGVSSAQERREFEQRMVREPALVDHVAFWESNLAGIAAGVAPETPPPGVWPRIDATLGATGPDRRNGVWRSVSFWRWSTVASTAIAVGCAAALAVLLHAPASQTPLVATLDTSGRASFVATIDPNRNVMTIVPAALTDAAQHSLQLWLIAPGDRPRSLGLIEPGRPIRINVPADLVGRIAADAVLAVSVEPVGGSPTGLPTGKVIANGKLTSL